MPKRLSFLDQRTASWVLVAATIVLIALYLRIHAALIPNPWPITVREAAFILQTEALLNPESAPMYSLESVPENTNLYGPLYPLSAAPLAALLPGEPYLAHRLTVAVFLVATCLLIGVTVSKVAGRTIGFAGAGLFYAATVATPSIAAGPDTLATLLYVAAICVFARSGPTRGGIASVVILGLLALLAKPYTVWVIPCMIVYIAWRRSLLTGAYCFLGTAMATTAAMALVSWRWPEYFFSVLFIHSAAATRELSFLTTQLAEFSWLNFAPLLLLLVLAPYKKLFAQTKQWSWKADAFKLSDHYLTWCVFMAIAAAMPLFLSLGWHGGAYIIYFNHLWLAPLLIASLSLLTGGLSPRKHAAARFLLTANAAVLILLLPPAPAAPETINLSNAGTILADPVFEPIRRLYPGSAIVDNGQAEYWVRNAKTHGGDLRKRQVHEWEAHLTRELNDRTYDTLLLGIPYLYSRDALLTTESMSPALVNNYEFRGKRKLPVYFLPFRNRKLYGKLPISILLFTKKEDAPLP